MLLSNVPNDLEVLKLFDVDNVDLSLLESKISGFNMFEAVGMHRQEIRHSTFLAFLIDPSQNHGLGDRFLKEFLAAAFSECPGDIRFERFVNVMNLDFFDSQVAREQDHIDIRIVSPSNELVVIIENKIYSDEHSDQLSRYFNAVQDRYSSWTVLPIYLTLAGGISTRADYVPMSYETVAKLVQDYANRDSTLQELKILLSHYVIMLRRHLLQDTELDELCAQIYQKHKRALDLIYERKPDGQAEVIQVVEQLIRNTEGVILKDEGNKSYCGFIPKDWVDSDLELMFYFDVNNQTNLVLTLQIAPGRQEYRQKVWDFAKSIGQPFKLSRVAMPINWAKIYKKNIVDLCVSGASITSETVNQISVHWIDFLSNDFVRLCKLISTEFGIAAV